MSEEIPDPIFHTDNDRATKVRGAATALVEVSAELLKAINVYDRTINAEASRGIRTNNMGPGGWHADWVFYVEQHRVEDWFQMVVRIERYAKAFVDVKTDTQVAAAYDEVFVRSRKPGVWARTFTMHLTATHKLFSELSARETVNFPRFRQCLVAFLDLIRPEWRTDPEYCNHKWQSKQEVEDAFEKKAREEAEATARRQRDTCIMM
ncbi:Hypothetical protein POVN_LOCUS552 [uncultured virus]|nr:Hypothetical protein POVN_LOCUS552 [uncultured virus]